MKTVLILGASGNFGAATASAFVEKKWRVLGLVRPGKEGSLLAGVSPVKADLFDVTAARAPS
jgi:NAD(P)-dependent dehydrogenase (short-subunit alcohol dehydrogenase family)